MLTWVPCQPSIYLFDRSKSITSYKTSCYQELPFTDIIFILYVLRPLHTSAICREKQTEIRNANVRIQFSCKLSFFSFFRVASCDLIGQQLSFNILRFLRLSSVIFFPFIIYIILIILILLFFL